jgi:hypothetical protein
MWSLSGRAEIRRSNRLILAPWSRLARACGILVVDPSMVPPDIRLCRLRATSNHRRLTPGLIGSFGADSTSLTKSASYKAGHMTAPRNDQNKHQIALAPKEPSTHDNARRDVRAFHDKGHRRSPNCNGQIARNVSDGCFQLLIQIIEISVFILSKIARPVNARHDQTPAYRDDTASIGHFEP